MHRRHVWGAMFGLGGPGAVEWATRRSVEVLMTRRHGPALILGALYCLAAPAAAQPLPPLHRDTIWDLKIGASIAEQPSPEGFRAFACGSNGGPPRAPLKGWSDFKRCPAD